MQNYRRIGDYISVLDNRNIDGRITNLMGISIDKCYIPSVANVIGTDLHNYKIIKKGQFACSLMQVSRDESIPLAMYVLDDPAIMSPAYVIFEIKHPEILLPAYVDLWFKRTEFDREASFYAVGGVRGSLDWADFCEMKLPIPPLDEQKKIVHNYEVIIKRISLLQKINDNLVQQARSVITYKVGSPILINLIQSEIDQLQLKYDVCEIKDYCREMTTGSTPLRTESKYWSNGTVPWLKSGEVQNCCIFEVQERVTELALKETSIKMLDEDTVVMAMYGGGTASQVGFLCVKTTTNQAICGMKCWNFEDAAYLFFALLMTQQEIYNQANGGAQDNLSKEMIGRFRIVKLPHDVIQLLGLPIFLKAIRDNTCEMIKLNKIAKLLISKI